jgi:signal transduction histidine kinase
MSAIYFLEKIRPIWLSRVSEHLAQGEKVKESFDRQLNRFYDLLIQAVEVDDSSILDPLLVEWTQARTETELNLVESTLLSVIGQMFLFSYDVVRESLAENDALELLGVLLPIYYHALEYASTQETKLHIQHITTELNNARLTLEKLEKSKSDFISVAAHELKTPLTLIDGYASMLHELLPGLTMDGQSMICLNGIKAGTGRLREIVDDMIDVSLIDNNLLAINFQPVWLNRLLNQVQRDLKDDIRKRRLNLDIRSYPGSNEMIFGDGERLYQALRNVITNAIKYTPDGGSIVVDGRLLPGFIETVITDTGIGIDPEDYARIFEKFGHLGSVSLHSSGKTKFKGGGPGLGLPITKGIIESHGGTIWVESEGYDEAKYPGSKFHILLPIRKAPPDDKMAKLFHALIEDGDIWTT